KRKKSGTSVLINIATSKAAVEAMKKAHEIGWKPVQLLNTVSTSVGVVMKVAGIEASRGLITALYMKDSTVPQWKNDPAMKDWFAFMKKYYPEGNTEDGANIYGVLATQTLVQTLKQCGTDFSRANAMKQAANLK